jgi:hypothetical protein
MQTRIFTEPAEFLQAAGGYIESEPFSSSVVGVWARRVVGGDRPHHDDDIFITVSDGERVVGAAMHTPPFHIFLARMPTEAAAHIAETLHEAGRHIDGVNGVTEAVAAFAEVWRQRTGLDTVQDTAMRL